MIRPRLRARAKSSRFCTPAHCLPGGSLIRGFSSRLHAPFLSQIDRVILARVLIAFMATWLVGNVVVPDSWAVAPVGRFVVDAPAGTVLDSVTKLTWQRTIAATSKLAWLASKDGCTNLDLAGKGWRLPTVRELRSLVDRQQNAPTLDPTAFPQQGASSWYWSASLVKDSPDTAWVVDFSNGESYGELLTKTGGLRRCVR